MKTYPPARRRQARHPRVIAFLPVELRSRADGWTAERQGRFLAELAITRSVSAAARKVGMARETAYRLRRKPGAESFAAAWDAALGRARGKRKVTAMEIARRATEGLVAPRIYRGRFAGIGRKADNTALLRYLAQLDRAQIDEADEPGWSQSFTSDSAFHERPLSSGERDPISGARRNGPAPDLRGKR
jgi:hypothetical protein